MKILQILSVILAFALHSSDAYKILAIYPFEGVSHKAILMKISKTLASRGHQIDVVSHFPLKEPMPNYTDITLPLAEPWFADYSYVLKAEDRDVKWPAAADLAKKFCSLLEEPYFQKLLKHDRSNPPYDLIIYHYLSAYQCLPALAYVWDIPLVGLVTTAVYPKQMQLLEQPMNFALYPSYIMRYKNKIMNFWERLANVVFTRLEIFLYDSYVGPVQQHYLDKHFGPNIPNFKVLQKASTSLILSNSHFSFNGPRPKSPRLIEIGGIHIDNNTKTQPLDKNLKEFLDQSESGFIYFSFGTLVRIDSFPPEKLKPLYEAIDKVAPVRVLVRVPNPEAMPKNWPSNTFVHKWLPQQEILKHPKIKGFMGHGGVHGVQEAIWHAVPMICVPFFADQSSNCDLVQVRKIGLRLDWRNAKQEDYYEAFRDILTNFDFYKESAKNLSALFKDRPRPPIEEAMYWIEYILRNGKDVLKSPGANLDWWQIELLDVYLFIVACLLFGFGGALLMMYMVLRRLKIKIRTFTAKGSSKKIN